MVENLPWTACVLAPDDEIEDRSVAGNSDLDGEPIASWHELTHALGVLQRLAAMLQLHASGE